MPVYKYTALNSEGKKVSSSLEVPAVSELNNYLKQNNQILVSYKEVSSYKKTRKLNYRDLSEFCRQLGTLQASGVSLVRALNIISHNESLKPWQKEIYEGMIESIKRGNSLSTSMEERVGAFPELLINMFKSAEMSGNIEKTSTQMCEYYEKQFILNKKISTSMVYPIILIILIVFVVIFLVSFVIPQLQPVLDTLEEMPAVTAILLSISDAFINRWYIILGFAIGIVVTFLGLLKVDKFRYLFDKMKVKMPYFGRLNKTIYTARFSRTIASLYVSGLPIVSALAVGSRTIGNKYIESQFQNLILQVRSGRSLSECIKEIDGFVSKLADTTLIGEETGNLADMLVSTADSLEYDADVAITKMVTSIEPILIIVMAIVVGFVMVAILLPVFQSYSAVGAQNGI